MRRRIAYAVAALATLYLGALVIAGFVLSDSVGERIVGRVGESLQGTATIGETDLALVRGRIELERLAVRRSDAIGSLALDVAAVRCQLPPLGLALVDGECRELAIDGVRLEVSTFALFKLEKRKRRVIHVERVIIRDASLAFSPSTFAPGLGAMRVKVERAVAGPTTFRSPLSWIFAATELVASVELPAGISVRLEYAGGMLRASGSLFGSRPVEVPVVLPVATAAADARAELELLVAFARDLATRLVAQRAEDWLKSKLPI